MNYGKISRLNFLIVMLAVTAGIIILMCGFFARLPKNVTVNGIEVGGKPRAEAVRLVRESIEKELAEKSLTVYGKSKKYVFRYPEIGYRDNLQKLLQDVKKGGSYRAEVKYHLNGLSEITAAICADESSPLIEPYAIFNTSGEAFTYVEGSDGAKADRLKLISDINSSLCGDFCDVYISVVKIKRQTSSAEVRYNTRLLSTFTTYFDSSNVSRSHNIRLAASKINGLTLERGQNFSFNEVVGERTLGRGFRKANIIQGGEFVEGVGGGVCQVSTTVYNAALLAGCKISEYHAHSLPVSYVPPSFDAMVSGNYFDLKFVNSTGYKLYIRAVTGKNYVTFNIYGRGDGAKYSYSSVVTSVVPAPVELTDDSSLVKEGKDGMQSEGYLTITRNGIQKNVLLRRDKYAPVKRVKLDGQTNEEPPVSVSDV